MRKVLFILICSFGWNQDVILTFDCPEEVSSGSELNWFSFHIEIQESNIVTNMNFDIIINSDDYVDIDIYSWIPEDPYYYELFSLPCLQIDGGLSCLFETIEPGFYIIAPGIHTFSYAFSTIEVDSEVTFSFSGVDFRDLEENILEVEYSNICTFQIVGECNLGDLNNDGTIDVLDVVQTVNIIISLEEPTDDELCFGDINDDGAIDVLDIVQLVNIILLIDDTPIYSNNPDMNGQFLDAVLINRNPDCRAYAMDANNGDYGSSMISDISNGISDAVSDVHIDLVIASNWNPTDYDYDSVTLTLDSELATHCRMISNMIPNHTFGVEVTGPDGDGWIHAIDHSDIEVTYIPVDPVLTDIPTDTPRNPPTYDFDGILLNGVGISMDSGFCYNPGVITGPPSLQSNEAGNTSGCGPQNSWFELPAYTIWQPDAEYMAAVFDSYFAHGYEGTYHYHALTHPLQEDTDQTEPPITGDGSPVIGFAPDGFPLYGHWFIDTNNQLVKAESGYETYLTDSRTPIETALHGTPPTPWDIANNPDDFSSDFGLEMGRYEEDWYFAGTGNLDECNGAYDVNGDYGYYITDKYPFTPPCIFGTREPSFSKQSPTIP